MTGYYTPILLRRQSPPSGFRKVGRARAPRQAGLVCRPDSIKPNNEYEKGHIDYGKDLKKITGEFLASRRPADAAEKEDLPANTVRPEPENRREAEKQNAPKAPEEPVIR